MPEEIYVFSENIWPFVYKSVHYCISDMGGEDRDTYLTALAKRIGPERTDLKDPEKLGEQMMSNMEGWSTMLLPFCTYLYNPTTGTRGELVPASIISKWPSRLIDMLIEKANDVTGIGSVAKEEGSAKND